MFKLRVVAIINLRLEEFVVLESAGDAHKAEVEGRKIIFIR